MKYLRPNPPAVPFVMDKKVEGVLASLEQRVDGIDAVEVTDRSIRLLGFREKYMPVIGKQSWYVRLEAERETGEIIREGVFKGANSVDTFYLSLLTLGLYALTPGVRKRMRQKRAYQGGVEQIQRTNLPATMAGIKHIRVYNFDTEETRRVTGMEVEILPAPYEGRIWGKSPLDLKVEAYKRSADAVISYRFVGPDCFGVPVRLHEARSVASR